WKAAQEGGASFIGANCGIGIDAYVKVARELAQCGADLPLWIKGNAGLPKMGADGSTHYTAGPEDFSRAVPELVAAGVRFTGGCCQNGAARAADPPVFAVEPEHRLEPGGCANCLALPADTAIQRRQYHSSPDNPPALGVDKVNVEQKTGPGHLRLRPGRAAVAASPHALIRTASLILTDHPYRRRIGKMNSGNASLRAPVEVRDL